MMEFTSGVKGIGICLEDMEINDPERVEDLICLVPEMYGSFSNYCNSHDILCTSMHDFSGWIGCQTDNYAIAVILSRVIAIRENVFFEPVSECVGDLSYIITCLVFEKKEPWKYSDREKTLTLEECRSLLERYTAFISDDVPDINLM